MNHGRLWVEFDRRLGDDWGSLATMLGISAYDQGRFPKGDEGRAIRSWLDRRKQLAALPEALRRIERADLADLVSPAVAEPREPERAGGTASVGRWSAGRRIAVVAVLVVAVATAAAVWKFGLFAGDGNSTESESCPTVSSPGTVDVTPFRAEGLTFCPVTVNGGTLPITGPFSLRGRVLGDRTEILNLALFVRIDPQTCDAAGRRGAPGFFLLVDVAFGGTRGEWSHDDDLGGHSAGVTYGRIFHFASMRPEVRQSIAATEDRWSDAGLSRATLGEVRFLAEFSVPPGVASDTVECRG